MATKAATKPTAPAAKGGNVSQLPAKREETRVAKGINYDDVQVTGMEGADRDSFLIPRLVVLQKMSPQLDKGDENYIKGAEEGDILNTATLEVYGGEDGIEVLPVMFKRSFTQWVLREKGGGLKGEYSPTDPIVTTTKRDEKNREILPDGDTQLVDTRTHAVVLLSDEGPIAALITFTSTQIKKSKRWMTHMHEMHNKDHLPTLAHKWKLSTTRESNDKGSWSGWVVEPIGQNDDAAAKETAVGFLNALQTGDLKIKADASMRSGDADVPF
jgi:hypothetical protein